MRAAQAEALQQLMAFFRVEGTEAVAGPRSALPVSPSAPGPAASQATASPPALAVPSSGNGGSPSAEIPKDHDFTRF